MAKSSKTRQRPVIEELEARILYSADTATLVAANLSVQLTDAPEYRQVDGNVDLSSSASQVAATPDTQRLELVFVDPRVPDYQQIVDSLTGSQDSTRRFEIVMLDAGRDGIEQISQTLAGYRDVSAIHLISHGADDEVQIGSTWLTAQNLESYAQQLGNWQNSLTQDADLLLYGCDVAAGADGRALADTLARLTGADVAASEDATGNTALGGDWDMEYLSGSIETHIIAGVELQQSWMHTLATETVLDQFTTSGSFAGNDGSQNWSTSWASIGGASASVTTDSVGYAMLYSYSGPGTTIDYWRQANLTGATSATLTFDYRRVGTEAGDDLTIYASNNGNSGWIQVGSIAGGTNDGAYITTWSANITSYISSTTAIRFSASLGQFANDTYWIDNVKITYVTNTAPVVANLNTDILAYSEGGGAVVIDQGSAATVTDSDSANFDTAALTVRFASGSTSTEDVLAIRNQGTGAGQIGVSGSNVTYGGVTIGTYTGGGSGSDLVVTFNASSSPAAAQALLQNITYQNTNNNNPSTTSRTVTFVLTDGDGGTSNTSTATINVTAVNDAPVNSVPVSQSVNEDTTLTFSSGNGNLISISDVDISGSAQATLGVTNGTLTLSGIAGLTFTTGDGTSDASMVFTGSVAAINTALAGLTYTGNSNWNGAETLTLTTSDQGGTGSGGTLTDTDTVAITVNAVNDPATASNLSAAQSYTEDTPLSLTPIVISDVDNTTASITLTLSAPGAGSLNTGTSGAVTSTYNAGTGVWSASGAISNINTLLAGLTFTPALNYNSNFTIATSVNSGEGSGVKAMTGIAVNDPATASNLSAAQSYTEDTPLSLTPIVISDVDNTTASITLTLSAPGAGSLNTGTSGAVTSTYNAGTGVWSAAGAIADINTLLAGLTFTPAANYNSNFTIATSVNSGEGSGVKAMTGIAVNDPATASNLSAAQSYTEDTPLSLTPIVISDVDNTTASITLTLSAPGAGSLNTGTSGAVTSTYNAGTCVWSASGAIADVNSLLAGLTFTPAANYNSNFTIATSVNSGEGSGVKAMTGVAVNDPASATNLSAAETYVQNTPLSLTPIVISDVDNTTASITLTLSDAAAGSLNTGTSGAVTSTYNAGTGVWSASGAISDINALLAALTFTPALNYNSNFTIATSVNSGEASGVKAMSTAVNMPATASNLSAAETYTEDTPLNLTDIVISDVDNTTASITLTLSDAAAGSLNTGTSGAVTSTFAGGVWSASGAIADVNSLLAGLTFTPAANYNSNFTIATSVNSGEAGGVKAMTGVAVNDPASATNLSAAETYTEDTPLNLTDIVISDVDNTTASITLTLSDAAAGSLNTGTSGAVTSTFAGGVWSAAGAIADINTLLAGLTFTPALNYNSNFTIATSVNSGEGSGVKAMTGIAVNDPATASNLSAAQSYTEDTPLSLTPIVISDVDNTTASITLTLSAPGAGSLNTGTSGAVTSTYNAGTGVWSASGAIADVNSLLAGLTFTPAANYNSNFTIATSVNSGEASGVKAMTGVAVNDPPVGTDSTVTTIADTTYTFTTGDFGFTDVDSGDALTAVRIDSLPAAGIFTLSGSSIVAGNVVLVADIAAGSLVFTPVANTNGAAYASFSFSVRDSAGTFDTTPHTLTVNVAAAGLASAPVVTIPAITAEEQRDFSSSLVSTRSDLNEVQAQAPVNTPMRHQAPAGEVLPSPLSAPLIQENVNTPGASTGLYATPVAGNSQQFHPFKPYATLLIDALLLPQLAPQLPTAQMVAATVENPPGATEAPEQVNVALKSIEMAGIGLSISTLAWVTRGGGLLASLLASAPAWRNLDPLPVLARSKNEEENNKEGIANHERGDDSASGLPEEGLSAMEERR